MRFAYSKKLSPPGLLLPTFFRRGGSQVSLTVECKIDTGADMTAIPLELKSRLKIKDFTLRSCKGALDKEYRTVSTCFIEYSFDGKNFSEIEVLATARPTVLLGRDILNGFVLTANGPEQFFEIQQTTGKKSFQS